MQREPVLDGLSTNPPKQQNPYMKKIGKQISEIDSEGKFYLGSCSVCFNKFIGFQNSLAWLKKFGSLL